MDAGVPDRVRRVLHAAVQLSERYPSIVAIGLAGSWARGQGRADSDVDLIVLTPAPAELFDDGGWIAMFEAGTVVVSRRNFGAIQERRLRLPDGLEIEVGVGRPEWASISPLDEGTATVVADGFRPLFDPQGLLATLLTHCG